MKIKMLIQCYLSVFLHSDATISSTGTEKMHESAIRFSILRHRLFVRK